MKRIARSRWPLPCFAAVRRGFGFFGEDMCDWDKMEGKERSVEEELKVCESQPVRRVGRSDMRVDEDWYIETDGRMSEMLLSGRSGQLRARGESVGVVSTITGISSTLSSRSLSPSVPADLSSYRPLRVLACLGGTAEDVCVDELELAMLDELSVAVGSISDLDLSRLCFCRNLGSFEPC